MTRRAYHECDAPMCDTAVEIDFPEYGAPRPAMADLPDGWFTTWITRPGDKWPTAPVTLCSAACVVAYEDVTA